MLKIVYVVPTLAPYMIPMFEALSNCPETEVHIIVERSSDPNKLSSNYQDVKGCMTYLLDSKSTRFTPQKNRKGDYVVNSRRLFPFGLKKVISKINPDIVIVCNAVEYLFAMGRRKYILATIVEDTLRADEKKPWYTIHAKKMLYKKGELFIPFTTDAVEFLNIRGIKANRIISSWAMGTDFFSDLKKTNSVDNMKKKLGLNGNINYVLPAMLIKRKGIVELLEAWKEMDIEFLEKTHLFVLGDGPLLEKLQNICRRNNLVNIHFKGLKPYQVVSHYMQCADVFILPTLEDLCSLSVLEGMASGLPILTTIYNGAREFVSEGENGFIFDPKNKESIKATLVKLNKVDLIAFSQKSLEIVESYSPQVVMRKLRNELGEYYNRTRR